MKNVKLTYFTPTYNRAYILDNLYNSLLSQTRKDFIWLIIDDGSTDNTEELVNGWKKENKIEIEYIKKENGGKNTAIDLSNEVCKTEYISCIDSDDTLTDNATEVIYSKLYLASDSNICGLVSPRKFINPRVSVNWTIDDEKIYFYDIEKVLGAIPDTMLIFKTEIAKKFHFPKIPDEKFITESVYYKQFFYDYKLLAFKDQIYITKYLDDGYTQQGLKLFFKNPKGYAYALKQDAYFAIKKRKSFIFKVKKAMIYYGWIKLNKISEDFAGEYDLPKFYKFVGKSLSWIAKIYYNRKKKNDK